jgi:hypothetical protein
MQHSSTKVRTEIYSRADSCIAGSDCPMVESSGRTVTVLGFSGALHAEKGPIATVAILCTNSATGDQFCLISHFKLLTIKTRHIHCERQRNAQVGLLFTDGMRQFLVILSGSTIKLQTICTDLVRSRQAPLHHIPEKPEWDEWTANLTLSR